MSRYLDVIGIYIYDKYMKFYVKLAKT